MRLNRPVASAAHAAARPARRPRPPLTALLYSAALALAIGAAPVAAAAGDPAGARTALAGAAAEALPNLVVHEEPRGPWTTPFETGTGESMTLAAFEGEVVVLNLWATWCPPCVHEMPALDNLAAALRGTGARVVALSTDRGGAERVRAFFADTGNEAHPVIENLAIHVDPTNRFPREAAVVGLPVTLILDREGREVARLTGDAEWDAPAIVAMIEDYAAATAQGAGDGQKDAAAGPGATAAPSAVGMRKFMTSPLAGTAL